jgi:outer membrane protein TolC
VLVLLAVAGGSTPAALAQRSAGAAASEDRAPLVLDLLIREALERSPDVAAMARGYDAMRARVAQAKAWPEPTVEVGSMGSVLPFDVQNGDPSSARVLTVTQEVVWPGKLSLMGKMAGAEARAEWWSYEAMRREVVAEVKDTYFDLWYLTKAVDVTSKNRSLMERIAKIAEARYAVGKGMQTDVLKARLEVSMLLE